MRTLSPFISKTEVNGALDSGVSVIVMSPSNCPPERNDRALSTTDAVALGGGVGVALGVAATPASAAVPAEVWSHPKAHAHDTTKAALGMRNELMASRTSFVMSSSKPNHQP